MNQISFEKVHSVVQHREDLKLLPDHVSARARGITTDKDNSDYDVIDLNKMRFMTAGSVFVPPFGLLEMNEWSKRQLGAEIGVKWGKFFESTPVDQVQRAVGDHLRTRKEPLIRKIIARSFDTDEVPQTVGSNGVLRAFVGPKYNEIRDARIFNRVQQSMGTDLKDMHFKMVSFKPNASHFFLTYNDPFDAVHDGKMPIAEADNYFFGIRIRNSEVGGGAFTGSPWFVKFICSNGMIVGVESGPLLYRTHRNIEDNDLDLMIHTMFRELPDRKKRITEEATKLHEVVISDPLDNLKNYLRGQPKNIIEAAETSWHVEGEPNTAFDIAQTISRVAMALRSDRDRQLELEKLAGRYIYDAINKHK
jgi:hypothetical protein